MFSASIHSLWGTPEIIKRELFCEVIKVKRRQIVHQELGRRLNELELDEEDISHSNLTARECTCSIEG